jgi:hypothetical protein
MGLLLAAEHGEAAGDAGGANACRVTGGRVEGVDGDGPLSGPQVSPGEERPVQGQLPNVIRAVPAQGGTDEWNGGRRLAEPVGPVGFLVAGACPGQS